jgi:hypothetical protein
VNLRAFLGVVASVSVAALGAREAFNLIGDETPPVAGDRQIEPEKVVALLDGGTGYVAEYRTSDGGRATRLVSPACVRRLPDAGPTACRMVLRDGGLKDPGPLNRFPADASVGAKCQRVACSLYADTLPDGGDPANDEEIAIVTKQRSDAGTKDAGGGGK